MTYLNFVDLVDKGSGHDLSKNGAILLTKRPWTKKCIQLFSDRIMCTQAPRKFVTHRFFFENTDVSQTIMHR